MADHVMIDLETMGTGNKAAIISIGAARFNLDDGITTTFHVGVELASNKALGMEIDAGTVMWWLSEDRAAARREWLALPKVELIEALYGLTAWLDEGEEEIAGVWGNGATFDNVILRNAYAGAGLECPWPFWKDRCFRTMKTEFPSGEPPRSGTHHAALDDAIYQATWLLRIWRHNSKTAVFEPFAEQASK